MGLVFGIPLFSFLSRFTTEPLLVLKTCILYWWIRYVYRNKRLNNYDVFESVDLEKNGIVIPRIEHEVERPHLQLKENAKDAVFFYGGNSAGARLLVTVSRSKDYTTSCLYLKLASGTSYELPNPERSFPPSNDFYAGGLRIKCVSPMRRWRISFNGFLREINDGVKETRVVHVIFTFIVNTSSQPFDLSSDIPAAVLADFVARKSSSPIPTNPQNVLNNLDSAIQATQFLGSLTVEESSEVEIYLWGSRKRSYSVQWDRNARLQEFFGYTKEGQMIYTGEYTQSGKAEKLSFAFYLQRNTLSWPVTKFKQTFNSRHPQFSGMKIDIQTERSCVSANVNAVERRLKFMENGVQSDCYLTRFNLHDGDIGYGVFLDSEWRQTDVLQNPPWHISIPENLLKPSSELVLTLSDPTCQNTKFSGGKGASLATLTYLTRKYRTGFKVPPGLAVTTQAYKEFYVQAGVSEIVSEFEKTAWSYETNQIKSICNRLVTQVSNAELSKKIKLEIQKHLNQMFNGSIDGKRFAVRSSASGEDSEEMSAAGQMSTFLAVEGLQNIYSSVIKCWASQFSFTAVQYKRQNGQELNSPMAVVIQEMVPADTAGVLFTCDPVTGNPRNVTITANYGLGESVVSASADPDTIVFERNETNQLSLKSVQKGKKTSKIVMTEEGSVSEELVDESLASTCCLSENHAKLLAETGLKIESSFGIPIDIEWAYSDSNLYMLQARPVTTIGVANTFELANETNLPMRAEEEYSTRANVGEVMPGFISHLGLTFNTLLFQKNLQELYGKRNKYSFPYNPFYSGQVIWKNQFLFSMSNMLLRFYKKGEGSFLSEANVISTFGRRLDDDEMYTLVDRRNRMYPTTFMPYQLLFFIQDLVFARRRLTKAIQEHWNKETDLKNCKNSKEMYETIWRAAIGMSEGFNTHLVCTMSSSIFNNIMLGILATENKGWDSKVFSDFAKLLSSCGKLESADIPRSTTILSNEIRKSIDTSRFQQMTVEEAIAWLETTKSSAGDSFRNFLKKHGHRCLKEFDLYSKPWRIDHHPIVKMLQDSLKSRKENTQVEVDGLSASEIIKSLSIPLSLKSRVLLRILIPLSQRAVFDREKSKSMAIKTVDIHRKAFCTLSEQMVKEGLLPDKELIFFLTVHEVHELIHSRPPILVQRAIRRKHLSRELDKIRFPEIIKGIPMPVNDEDHTSTEDESSSDLEIKGVPVSQGVVKAYARIATELEEAANIQAGEVLIAYSTDIAWSPYFPLLSGVATELGGLISHGAVVAREYGLPCVVAVHGATSKFKTGDYVYLDGNKGILKRIPPPKEE